MVTRKIDLDEKRVYVPTLMIQEPILVPIAVAPLVTVDAPSLDVTPPVESSAVAPPAETPTITNEIPNMEPQQPPMDINIPINEPLRRSQRNRRSAISDDYVTYMSEDIDGIDDPTSFNEAMKSEHSSKWLDAM